MAAGRQGDGGGGGVAQGVEGYAERVGERLLYCAREAEGEVWEVGGEEADADFDCWPVGEEDAGPYGYFR